MRRRNRIHSAIVVLGCLTACDPAPQNLGENSPGDAWAVDWRIDGPPESFLFDVAVTEDGGAVVVGRTSNLGVDMLRRYTSDGALAWEARSHGINGGQLTTQGTALFFASEANDPQTPGSRARVRRLSSDGVVEAEWMQTRDGDSNTFTFDIATSATEVALVMGHWGQPSYEGEPFFEVVRLDHDLHPIADPLPFESRVEQVEYDHHGNLVILETPNEGPAHIHRPTTGAPPLDVDCASLLTGSGEPLCVNARPDYRVLNYETGDVVELDDAALDGFARSTRASSTVLAATEGDTPMRVSEFFDDGTLGRSATLPFKDGTEYVLPIAIRQTHDGAAYAIVTETARQDQCPGLVGANCWRSDLIRLAAD